MTSQKKVGGPGSPAHIEYKGTNFLIINQPSAANMSIFIDELRRYNSRIVVRCCDPTYSTDQLASEGIIVVDLPFDDGGTPNDEIVTQWLELIANTFEASNKECIAVHCVAGLGRAPVLVAIALMENGMKYHEAVEFIRQRRRGAINAKQLSFLEKYKPSKKHRRCRVQ
ncbi:PRL-1 phosphatase-like [Dysidea avara]|uniref:PRL-1 phosphatase-like n=1 Tax=Dysidea avara TaxID=196820 RepID=UPI00332D9B22